MEQMRSKILENIKNIYQTYQDAQSTQIKNENLENDVQQVL